MMSNVSDGRKKIGRPPVNSTPVTVRLPPDQLQRLDEWIEEDGGRFSRPEAIRVLLEHAWGRTAASRGVKTLEPRLKEPK